MGILEFLILCAACAALYWFLNWLFPIPPMIQKIMLAAIVILLLVLLLKALGLFPIGDVQIQRLR
jgi:hypothetical protein